MRAKYKHFRTICEQSADNSPTDSLSSFYWWSSMHGVANLKNCWVVFFASSQHLSTRFFAWPSKSQDQEDIVSASGFPEALVGCFSWGPAEILDSNMSLEFVTISWLIWHSLWVHPKCTWSRNDVGSPRSTSFMGIFQVGSMFTVLPASLILSTYTDKNSPCARLTNKQSQLKTFSQQCSWRTSSNCVSHKSSARGWPYVQIPFERNDWVFHTGPWFWPFVLR